jgi:hypothetical protein
LLATLAILAKDKMLRFFMILIDLAQNLGIDPKRKSNSKGGEYHSGCPSCREGVDRFIIWPQLNRYWCRRCGVNGDAIQFCRDFMDMSFHDARARVCNTFHNTHSIRSNRFSTHELMFSKEPPTEWTNKASAFVEWAHKKLKDQSRIMSDLTQRGLNETTINRFKLGYTYNPNSKSGDFFNERSEWGLSQNCKVDSRNTKLWLPCGLVIPKISSSYVVCKLKIRRKDWHQNDSLPKYVEISGSQSCPSIYGNISLKVAFVCESELDAILIQQEASDICFCIALGGAGKKPDAQTHELIKNSDMILWSLDNDEAGKKVAPWWRETYHNLKFWPVPIGKSPGDAFKDHNLNLRDWLIQGINRQGKIIKYADKTI